MTSFGEEEREEDEVQQEQSWVGRGFLPFFRGSKTPLSGTARGWSVGAVSSRHVRRGRMTDSFLPLCAHRKGPELGAVTLCSPGSPGVLVPVPIPVPIFALPRAGQQLLSLAQ